MRHKGTIPRFWLLSVVFTGGILLHCQPVVSQEISVDIRVEDTEFMVGEHVRLTLAADADRQVVLQWPEFGDTLAGGLIILKKPAVDTVKDANGIYHYTQTLVVSAFDTGTFVVEPVSFFFRNPGSKEVKTASSAPLLLTFTLMQVPGEEELRDIKPPIEFRLTFRELLPWILITSGILVLLFFLVRYLIRRRRRSRKVLPEPETAVGAPGTPWETALAALEKLKKQIPAEASGAYPFYTSLSDIVRIYLRDGLGIDAPDLTTRQTLQRLSRHPAADEVARQRAGYLLKTSDLVKFARLHPSSTDHLLALEEAVAFIRDTAPTLLPSDGKEGPL